MEHFSASLEECVKQTSMSVALFAREIGMNRGMLYNIWDGKRKLPEDRLQALFHKHIFAPAQENRLREAYYREVYGSPAFERLLYIKNALAVMASRTPTAAPLLPEPFAPEGNVVVISNMVRLLKVLRFMLEAELAMPAPQIDTNYPFSTMQIDDLMYTILSKSKKNVQFRHVLRFDAHGENVTNLQNLFASLRWLRLRHNPLCRISRDLQSELSGSLYPCFFVTNKHVLLFCPASGSGLFLSEPNAVETIALNVSQRFAGVNPLAQFPANEMELQQMYAQKSLGVQDGGGFSWWPCLVGLMDCDMLGQVAAPDLPARDATIQIIEAFYQTLLNNPKAPLFFTADGFRAFARTGEFHEATEQFLQKAPPALRTQVLRRVMEVVQNGQCNAMLLDEQALPYPQNFCLDFYATGFCVRGTISKRPNAFSGEYTIFSEDKVMLRDFENFKEYILQNHFYYPQDWTLNLLSELAAKCENTAS